MLQPPSAANLFLLPYCLSCNCVPIAPSAGYKGSINTSLSLNPGRGPRTVAENLQMKGGVMRCDRDS